jgi:c-di-GMP-binding flagellar brake protein YcgR
MGECEILEVVEIIQRQQDIRASVDITVQFTSENNGKSFFGVITNISAGGIYMVTSEPLTIGEILNFHYTFKNVERPFRCMVLWGQMDESGSNGYGLRFVELNEGGETAIRGYVFNVLREQRRNEAEESGEQ